MDHVDKTLGVYKALGQTYIDSVAPAEWEEVGQFASLIGNGKILDVGCTGGRDSKKFLDQGFEVVGIDLVDEFLDIASKNAPSGEFRKMDVRELGFDDNYFDGVWASMVLLHLKKSETERVIRRFSEILKPDGYLFVGLKEGKGERFITDPLTGNLQRFFKYYESDEIEAILKHVGFKIISSRVTSDNLGRDQKIIAIIAQNKK